MLEPMIEIQSTLEKIDIMQIKRLILSAPGKNSKWKKITAERLANNIFQVEKLTEKQAFHEKISADAHLFQHPIFASFGTDLLQMEIFENEFIYSFRAAKKRILSSRRKNKNSHHEIQTSQNREKNYILNEGMKIPALIDLGIFHEDCTLIKKSAAKFKQINRFIEFVDDMLKSVSPPADRPFTVVDFGCGKSYLTFILHYYLTEIRRWQVKITGMDLKKEVIDNCNQIAEKYGCNDLIFQCGDIGKYQDDAPIDMIVTLHACDTATDYALFHAVKRNVKYILSVPCCQHELNGQFNAKTLKVFEDYGLIQERFCTLLTDTIRAELLKSCNYNVQLMEFVDLSHTPKNIMIRAELRREKNNPAKHLETVKNLMEEFSVKPTLFNLLENRK